MALKYLIDKLVEVPGPLRDYYVEKDGTFVLDIDSHPDTVKAEDISHEQQLCTRSLKQPKRSSQRSSTHLLLKL